MSSCCPNKTVGGIPYTLVTEGPTGQYGPLIDYGCSEDCVYQPVGRPQDRVCFAPGVLETQCHPGWGVCRVHIMFTALWHPGPYTFQCKKPSTRTLPVPPAMNRQQQGGTCCIVLSSTGSKVLNGLHN